MTDMTMNYEPWTYSTVYVTVLYCMYCRVVLYTVRTVRYWPLSTVEYSNNVTSVNWMNETFNNNKFNFIPSKYITKIFIFHYFLLFSIIFIGTEY